ncbi:ABC transporter ATP-binding protein [uncultured Pseudodesulfovibrio sp.]|uniref:ABC transporter ATP-binding protein n=1 Tax=uncultured Pseudodesulfovibrio sp. TaxID=2035858 RepID=UPI0029C92362|nr:ABC transporter ATP-binding protein [uncultured Pseudodesulfovibrio sp.]
MFFRAKDINRSFDGRLVLHDVSFSVGQGDIVSFIGPSGVGKTTLLKIIAGLDEPDSGNLHFKQQPSRENPVILVFQDYLLFPNLTVFENAAFGLRARKVADNEIERRVMELLDHFKLADRRSHYPTELSAGQQQRVAIARAMVVNPAMLLLDEPFANLDRNLKLSTAEFIRDTQKEFGVTTIAVTHDQEEAFLMSDAVGVMLDGHLAQFAPADEIYASPASLDVAEFLGPINVLPPKLAKLLGLNHAKNGNHLARPENLCIEPHPNGFATVKHVMFVGHYTKYVVQMDKTVLIIFDADNSFKRGDKVNLSLKNL